MGRIMWFARRMFGEGKGGYRDLMKRRGGYPLSLSLEKYKVLVRKMNGVPQHTLASRGQDLTTARAERCSYLSAEARGKPRNHSHQQKISCSGEESPMAQPMQIAPISLQKYCVYIGKFASTRIHP
jgi:hypothetical protein